MGRLAKLLSFTRVIKNGAKVSDVQVDPGGGAIKTGEHFAPPGDDSYPLKTDRPFIQDNSRAGGESTLGYVDPISDPVALEGDKRIYGRTSAGVTMNQVWLKSDGSILISNDNGSILLRPDGSIKADNANGFILLEVDGGTLVTTPLSTFEAAANGSIAGVNGNGDFKLESGGDFVVNGVTIDTAGNITTPGTVAAGTVAATTSLTVGSKEVDNHNHTQGNDSGGNTEQDTGNF